MYAGLLIKKSILFLGLAGAMNITVSLAMDAAWRSADMAEMLNRIENKDLEIEGKFYTAIEEYVQQASEIAQRGDVVGIQCHHAQAYDLFTMLESIKIEYIQRRCALVLKKVCDFYLTRILSALDQVKKQEESALIMYMRSAPEEKFDREKFNQQRRSVLINMTPEYGVLLHEIKELMAV
ncbi:MAG: hypothetical protein WCW33_02885 [Candidatus Babeliales bacterium]